MPKDLIHFKVARMTADRLAGTRFAPALDTCLPGLLLGAVFHDALFYGATKRARPFARLAHRLHGAGGQDTYRLIRLQAAHAAQADNRNMAAALLVGMVSHLFADVVMHPMVWHLSGHYYADDKREKTLARQHHRALESLMDMAVCPEMVGRPLFLARNLLLAAGDVLYDALPVNELAALAETPPEQAPSGIRTAFRIYAGLQSAFPVKFLSRTLFTIMPLLPDAAREIIALFYAPQLKAQTGTIDGNIDYRHPVTGVAASSTIVDMMTEAADRAAGLCTELEGSVFNGRPVELPEDGPSMDAGLSGLSADAMRYFVASSLPKLP